MKVERMWVIQNSEVPYMCSVSKLKPFDGKPCWWQHSLYFDKDTRMGRKFESIKRRNPHRVILLGGRFFI